MKPSRAFLAAALFGAAAYVPLAGAVQIDCYLEYLESTGSQHIDTGYVFKTKPRVEARAMLMSTGDKDIAGTRGGKAAGCLLLDYKGNVFYYYYGNTSYKNGTSTVTLPNEWVDYVWSDQLVHNGVTAATQTSYDFSANTSPFWLFASGRNKASVRFQNVKMYDGDVLVRDLYPAKSEGVAGMHDVLNDVFYANAGTGSFQEGAAAILTKGTPDAFGSPTPAYGNVSNTDARVVFSLAGARTFADGVTAYPSPSGLERASFQKLTVVYSDGETDVSLRPLAEYDVADDKSIVSAEWTFASRECVLAVETRGSGQISLGASDAWTAAVTNWFATGTTVAIKARPADGFSFLRWEGDGVALLKPSDLRAAEISFPLDAGCPLTAVFVPVLHVAEDGDDAAAGTEDAPMQSLSAAVARAVQTPYTKVLVHPGTYPLAATLVVSNGVSITAADGPDADPGLTSIVYDGAVANTPSTLVRLSGTDTTIAGCRIHNAMTSLTLESGTVAMNCLVCDTSYSKGTSDAAVVVSGGTLVDSVITNNVHASSRVNAGGVCITNGGLVERCVITDNSQTGSNGTYGGGGGVCVVSGTLRNSLVARNTAKVNGAGVRMKPDTGASCTIENCTIVDNGGTATAASLAGVCMSGGTVVNCIVWGNSNFNGANDIYKSGGTVTYTAAANVPEGEGNTSSEPRFVDFDAADYRLAYCDMVDAGRTLPWHDGTADLTRTNSRVQGAAVDLGCYEYVPEPLACNFVVSAPQGFVPCTVTVTATVTAGSPASAEGLVYSWYFTGGAEPDVSGGDCREATWTYSGSGAHTIRFVVTNARGETASHTLADVVKTSPATVYVDASNAAGCAFPYDEPAKAGTNLAEVCAAAVDGTEIRLLPGDHPLSAQLKESGGKRIVGAGPGLTRIVYDGAASGSPGSLVWLSGAGTSIANCRVHNVKTSLTLVDGAVATNCWVCDTSYTAGESGAAVVVSGGTLVDSLVTNNVHNANDSGGGVSISAGGLVERCVITDNSQTGSNGTYGGGGGVCVVGGTLRNSLVARNTAKVNGAGVRMKPDTGASCTIENCTIVDNGGTATAASLAGVCMSGGTVVNCIVWGNSNFNGANDIYKSGGTVTYTAAANVPEGEGNTASEPRFVDFDADDYRLAYCDIVDAGRTLPWHDGTADLTRTNSRVQGAAVDLGCYEYVPEPLACNFVVSAPQGFVPCTVTVTATVTAGSPASAEGIVYSWYFTGGAEPDVSGGDCREATWTYSGCGLHTIRLVVTNARGESASHVLADAVKTSPATVYVDASNVAGCAFPYDDPTKAGTNLAEVCAAAVDGTEIRLLPGDHPLSAQVKVSGGKRIVGAGPGRTRIVYEGAAASSPSPLVWLSGAGTSIANCRVHNAQTSLKLVEGAVATNCWVCDTSCSVGYSDAAVVVSGGTLVDSLVTNNVHNAHDFGGGVSITAGGLVERCVIVGNLHDGVNSTYSGGGGVYMTGGTLRNSLVARNSANVNGAGVRLDGGTVENCTVVDNGGSGTAASLAGIRMTGGTVVNSIIWGNFNAGGVNNISRSSGTVTYTCTVPFVEAVGNTDEDPLFRRPGNYRLLRDSPCVNTGSNDAYDGDLEGIDLKHRPRLRGKVIDMGCYEYQDNGLLLLVK